MRILIAALLACALLVPGLSRADDATGVTPTTITIGLHAPLSGAAPVRPEAFSAGKDLYWKWLKAHGGSINGRDVEVVFANDQYNPTTAVSVCNQMAVDQNAFLLVGLVGTDQINACAAYADPRGIPYVSPGVQETGLSSRSTYFALSATYPVQMRVIAQYIVALGASAERYGPGGAPACPPPLLTIPILNIPLPPDTCGGGGTPTNAIDVALVRSDSPNYNEDEDVLRAGLQVDGMRVHTYSVVKDGNSNEMQQLASQLRTDGIDVVVDMLAGRQTIELSLNMDALSYRPLILGPSTLGGTDQTAQGACTGTTSAFQGASFFTPWPAFSDAGNFDPDFVEAAHEFAPDVDTTESGGDILFGLWGLMKDVAGMLEAAGSQPTRESFLAAMNAGYGEETGVYPSLTVSSENHLGAQAMHRVEADCADKAFHERDAFVSGYAKP